MVEYYRQVRAPPPPGFGQEGWIVKQTHMGSMLSVQPDWVQKAAQAARLMAQVIVRRRRPQVDIAYRELYSDRVGDEEIPDEDIDDDFEPIIVLNKGKGGEKTTWGVGSLNRELLSAEQEQKRAESRREGL